ncbi:sensor histidine kinase [Streptacidiphilus rugosus]|uniref:sensor histidine kinase n=1 Tax=Streptacidiphilus rugosus TaxID=405783 RepID=UPI00068B7136|nr:histidine kinase [Streptacidiphilus rugosus]
MWPFPTGLTLVPFGVMVALTAICVGVAVAAERAPDRTAWAVRAGRGGWPALAVLTGWAAFTGGTVLELDLRHTAPTAGYSILLPSFGPGGLASLLLPIGLLATALHASTPAPKGWPLPAVAVATGLAMTWSHWVGNPPDRTSAHLLVGSLVVPALALAGFRAGRAVFDRLLPTTGPAASGRWALLLPGVLITAVGLLGFALWTPASPGAGLGSALTGYAAGLVVLAALGLGLARRPRAAADLAALGLLAIGAYGVVEGGFGGWLPVVRTVGSPSGPPPPTVPDSLAHHAGVIGGIQGALLLGLGLWLLPLTVLPDARRLWGRGPDPALTRRVRELTETRAEAVSSAAAELRRIERDLHDGAQGRLVAIGMNLRTAEDLIRTSPAEAAALVVEARESSAAALEELRCLVRGIYPPVLADRGLGEAVRALALDLPLPCATEIDLPERLDPSVESACYFAVAELVTNAVRHASANSLRIRAARTGTVLRIEVTDDGVGGADPARGSGLAGVERRLAAFDGILAVSSPAGGPTIVVLEVPCG